MKHDDKIEISVTKFITWWIICAAWLAIGFNLMNMGKV